MLLSVGDVDAYHCMVQWPDAELVLATRIEEADEQTAPRLRRALVFRLLRTHDVPWDPKMVSLLSPADRRILADGVKARRGRKSPAELHHHIFGQWEWYQPSPGYTDNRLTAVDKTNIALADDPQRFIVPASTSPIPEVKEDVPSGCGCAVSAVGSGSVLSWIMVLLAAGMRRAE